LKRLQRSLTSAKSTSLCFLGGDPEGVRVDVGRALTALVSSIHRCGSPWSCTLCAPVVRQRRAEEIDGGLHRHLEYGGGAEFLTLTLRHHSGDTLASRLDPVTQSLRWVLKGAPWERRKSALGYVGAIKAIDITHGQNGWHPHSHSVLLFDRPLTDVERRNLRSWVFGRWGAVVERRGLGSITWRNGVDVRRVTAGGGISDYLAKVDGGWSPGLETARSDIKGASPFALLRSLLATGDASIAALWREYETATFGKRAVVWSPGLRGRLCGVEEEVSDVELAASEGLDLALLRAVVPTKVWNLHVREGTAGELLSDIERAAGALIFIADRLGRDLVPIGLPEARELSWHASNR
jgi:hypothetical protein